MVFAWLYRGKQISSPSKVSKVLVVSYYTKNCMDCNHLAHTMGQLAWFFGREPVEFWEYASHEPLNFQKMRAYFQQKGVWELVNKNYKSGTAVIYNLKTKQIKASLNNASSVSEGERYIKEALKP